MTNTETPWVSPAEIYLDEDTIEVASHSTTLMEFKGVAFIVASPVDLKVTAPDGTILTESEGKEWNQDTLPEYGYIKAYQAGGKTADIVIFPQRLPGEYKIEVIPEPEANPKIDTYTLEVSTGPSPEHVTVLAQHKSVPAPNESHTYTVNPAGSGGFSDTETLESNTYQAGTLDVSISNGGSFSPKLSPSQSTTTKTFTIENSGSLDAHYIIETENATGSCQTLQIKDDKDKSYKALSTYESSILPLNANTQKQWTFTVKDISSESNFPYGKQCSFDLKITAWQQNLANATSGFSDIETVGNTVERIAKVQPGDVVINEVYYDVDSAHGTEGYNEWVELYNQTTDAINLAGWKLCDNSSCDELPAAIIGKEGFAVLTASSTTWGLWPSIPAAAEKITVGGYLGNGLSNSGDYLTLKDDSGQEIDFVAWEQGADDDYPSWDIEADEGESITRKVKTTDTNSVSDWEVLENPNPGTNPHNDNDDDDDSDSDNDYDMDYNFDPNHNDNLPVFETDNATGSKLSFDNSSTTSLNL